MSKLRLGNGFSLPFESVTQTFAILAKRGVGKTYTASVMAEEMLKAGQQIVAIDPTGAWWGLRSEFPVAVLGGEHGDVPLEEHAGEMIAQAIVEGRFPAVLDLSLFRKGQMIRFMTAFAETLYRLNREAVHLFVDEADAVAPQGRTYGGDENRMLGAMEDIVRRGRKRGIGCTLITQRPAVLNKNVLTQCEVLVAMRLVHPKDIDAIEEWVNVHADPVQAKEMITSLPSLAIGTAWFWSPGFGDIFQRVQIRKRETFDSSATPKPGEAAKTPRKLAEIDLNALGEKIKATAAQAKQNDPRELKRRIADLERQLTSRPVDTRTVEVEKIVEVPVLKNGQLERTEKIADRLQVFANKFINETAELRRLITPVAAPRPSPTPTPAPKPRTAPRLAMRPAAAASSYTGHIPRGEAAILQALIQYPDGLRRNQLTVLTGYKRSSRDAYVQRLREKGLVESSSDRCAATEAGMAAMPDAEPLPSGEALQEFHRQRLPEGERKVLEILIAAYPGEVQREALDEATGYKRSSRDAYLNRLAAKELVEYVGRGEVRACATLFE